MSSEQQTVQYSVGSTNSISINASGEYVSNNKLTPKDGELLIHLVPQVTISVKNPSDYDATDISFSAANPTGFRLEYYYGSTQKADYIFCNDSSTAEEKFKKLYPTATIIRTAAISVDIPSQGWCDFILKAADDMYIRV